jgi:adenine-specific DNA-methyltransferase
MTTGDNVTAHSLPSGVLERFDLASASPLADRIRDLQTLFPEAVREGRVDVNALSRTISDWVDPGQERFGLTWPGRAECIKVIQQPSVGTLLPMRQESVDFDTTENVIIEGDNLEVLKLLQRSYHGRIKLIYIDPPYNTGSDLIYPDNFREGLTDYLKYSGQLDDQGFRLNANAEIGGRFHSRWLSMMYPRLFLARNLLAEDGTLFASIDDHEVHHFKMLLNDIFGEENFLGSIVRATGTTTGQDSRGFGSSFDYLLCYSKNAGYEMGGIPMSEKDIARFDLEDARGRYSLLQLRKTGSNDRREDRPFMFYPVEAPDGTPVLPVGPTGYESRWRCGPRTFEQLVKDDFIVWKEVVRDGTQRWAPYQKYYLEGRTKRPTPLWIDLDGNKKATLEVKELLGAKAFDNPKPTALLKRILDLATEGDAGDIVLDFFAGSGTTGHAVLAKNEADGGNRRLLLVQLPEPTDGGEYATISEITRERVRRVSQTLKSHPALGSPSDLGFRAYRLSSSNFLVWDGTNADTDTVQTRLGLVSANVLDGRSQEDLLTELLMKAGYPLVARVQELALAGKRVFSIEDNSLLVCLEPALTIQLFESMAALSPSLIIVLDAGFGNDDQLKVNALQTIRAGKTEAQSSTELKVV